MSVFDQWVGIGWAIGTAIEEYTDFSEWWYDWNGELDQAFFEWVDETFGDANACWDESWDESWEDACWDEAGAFGGEPGYTGGGFVGPWPGGFWAPE